MVAFYILTKGKHPFGEEPDRDRNLLDGNAVYLNKLKDTAAKDLISWMLSHDPKDRPSAEEALKHPYLQSKKRQFEMMCKVGNEEEIKKRDVKSDVVRMLNCDPKDWRSLVRRDILKYLSTDPLNRKTIHYKESWTDCLRLMRNVKVHWNHRPRPRPELFYVVGDPQEYFLNLCPNLPVVVHEIVRSSDWKERPDLKEYFG
jgi:serine/threonine-protein kinase/endoribonuclease IRE1